MVDEKCEEPAKQHNGLSDFVDIIWYNLEVLIMVIDLVFSKKIWTFLTNGKIYLFHLESFVLCILLDYFICIWTLNFHGILSRIRPCFSADILTCIGISVILN